MKAYICRLVVLCVGSLLLGGLCEKAIANGGVAKTAAVAVKVKAVNLKPVKIKKDATLKKDKTYLILTKEGKSITGVAVKDDAKQITLKVTQKNAKPKEVTIARDDIKSISEVATKKQTAAKVLISRGYQAISNSNVRKQVDVNDRLERFVVLAPGGPIVVEASISVDGKSFRTKREKLVDEVLESADVNNDGKKTWAEAIENPRFAFGRYRAGTLTAAQKQQVIKQYDANGDGLVNRYEARVMVAQRGGGGAFRIMPNYYGSRQPNVKSLLDTNKDGVISKDELTGSEDRLKSRDANDNDLLETSELGGGANTNVRYQLVNGRRTAVRNQTAHLLGPTANLVSIFDALKKTYSGKEGKLTAERFPLFPKLVEKLDLNKNGELEAGEMIGFHLLKPHLEIEVAMGEGENLEPGVTVKFVAAELGNTDVVGKAAGEKMTLNLPGVKIQVAVVNAVRSFSNYDRSAKLMITRYDTDKNGYLEKEELKANQYMVASFARWDANSDGKVYADEIKADYKRQQAPLLSQVALTEAVKGPSIFAALDQTGDNRLSLREMKIAGESLLKLDKNSDGKISKDEMPSEITLAFGRGGSSYNYGRRVLAVQLGRSTPANRQTPQRGPEWFKRMDRNGDGDVTPREFLGTQEQFSKLDTNSDGFIELKEAEAAQKKKPSAEKKAEAKPTTEK